MSGLPLRIWLVSLLTLSVGLAADLEPFEPDDEDGYCAAVRKALLPKKDYLLPGIWMICRPSFSEEYAVSVFKERDSYLVENARAAEKIYHYEVAESGDYTVDLRTKTKVHRAQRNLGTELGARLAELWTSAVKRTRYADESHTGMDGSVFEFNGSGYHGQCWQDGGGGVAAAMVELGKTLYAYGEGKPDSPGEKQLTERLDALKKALAAEG